MGPEDASRDGREGTVEPEGEPEAGAEAADAHGHLLVSKTKDNRITATNRLHMGYVHRAVDDLKRPQLHVNRVG